MADRILVSTEEMRATVQKYQGSKAKLQDAYEAMDAAVRILETIWRGAAYTAMRMTWSLTYKNISRSEERMRDAIDELNATAELFDTNETTLTSANQALDVGTSPFDS